MIKQLLTLYFKASGWKFVSKVPENVRSFVMIGAPHTSNYDFIPAMAVAHLMKRNAHFVIKKNWLKFPLNLILVPMGAIGIDRKKLKLKQTSYTDGIAQLFREKSDLVIMISPEATRSPNPHWKTGFYYIAQKAGVPLVLGYVDYAKKEAGLGMVIYPTDFEKDMATIMNFYGSMTGKKPGNFKLDQKY